MKHLETATKAVRLEAALAGLAEKRNANAKELQRLAVAQAAGDPGFNAAAYRKATEALSSLEAEEVGLRGGVAAALAEHQKACMADLPELRAAVVKVEADVDELEAAAKARIASQLVAVFKDLSASFPLNVHRLGTPKKPDLWPEIVGGMGRLLVWVWPSLEEALITALKSAGGPDGRPTPELAALIGKLDVARAALPAPEPGCVNNDEKIAALLAERSLSEARVTK